MLPVSPNETMLGRGTFQSESETFQDQLGIQNWERKDKTEDKKKKPNRKWTQNKIQHAWAYWLFFFKQKNGICSILYLDHLDISHLVKKSSEIPPF